MLAHNLCLDGRVLPSARSCSCRGSSRVVPTTCRALLRKGRDTRSPSMASYTSARSGRGSRQPARQVLLSARMASSSRAIAAWSLGRFAARFMRSSAGRLAHNDIVGRPSRTLDSGRPPTDRDEPNPVRDPRRENSSRIIRPHAHVESAGSSAPPPGSAAGSPRTRGSARASSRPWLRRAGDRSRLRRIL